MKVDTSSLSNAALDWAVAHARGHDAIRVFGPLRPGEFGRVEVKLNPEPKAAATTYDPSRDPVLGMAIMDQAGILSGPSPFPGSEYAAGIGSDWDSASFVMTGPTRLVAAMRCYVASRLGRTVDVPDVLMQVPSQQMSRRPAM